jgi:hypothetical protein
MRVTPRTLTHPTSFAQAAGRDDAVELLDPLNASDFEARIKAWLKAMAMRVGAAWASFYENAVYASVP